MHVSMKTRGRNTPVARIANASTPEQSNAVSPGRSPPGSYAAAAANPRRSSRFQAATVPPSAKSGNASVAERKESKASPPPSPGGASPVPGKDEHVDAALLLARDKEIAALKQELANRDVVLKGPQITVSTEAANVQPDSKDYWIDASGKKEKNTTNKIVVKHKPKPMDKPKADSATGPTWKGYCLEGCGCATCVAKREEPSKTEMLDPSKRVSKRPSP